MIIKYKHWIFNILPGWLTGLCLWRVLLFRAADPPASLVAHELVHFDQFKKLGVVVYGVKYWYFHFRYGYKNNPFEIEAYLKQHDTGYIQRAVKILAK